MSKNTRISQITLNFFGGDGVREGTAAIIWDRAFTVSVKEVLLSFIRRWIDFNDHLPDCINPVHCEIHLKAWKPWFTLRILSTKTSLHNFLFFFLSYSTCSRSFDKTQESACIGSPTLDSQTREYIFYCSTMLIAPLWRLLPLCIIDSISILARTTRVISLSKSVIGVSISGLTISLILEEPHCAYTMISRTDDWCSINL